MRQFHSTSELIKDLQKGRMIVLVDDEDRENEADLVLLADHVSTEAINFMIKEARGLLCFAACSEILDRLRLPMMPTRLPKTSANQRPAFVVSFDAASGIQSGVSAADRAHTIRVAADARSQFNDIVFPGHIPALRASGGGVLERRGHTEGAVDLARLAGATAAAVICEVLDNAGEPARGQALNAFVDLHQLKMGNIAELVEHRRLHRETQP